MGKAKLRREALRQEMLAQGALWDFPPSEREAAIVEELLGLSAYRVPRVPADQLARMRLPVNNCHANAQWYAKNDPEGQTRAVVGWLVQPPCFILHSVIETEGGYICITPSALNEPEILFVPDPKITWVETGEVLSPLRDGQIIEWPGVSGDMENWTRGDMRNWTPSD